MWVLWGKSWLWDIKHCWYNYPHHSVEKDVWWYYMVELSFYWSLCISQVSHMKLWSDRLSVDEFTCKNWIFLGTRCRRTRVLRHNCAHKTQNGKMLKRSAERVLRRHNCVIPIRHKIKIHFVLEDLSEDPRTPENSVDPTQNLCGPEDLIYQKKLLHCFLSSFKLLSQWEMHFFMAKSCQTEL